MRGYEKEDLKFRNFKFQIERQFKELERDGVWGGGDKTKRDPFDCVPRFRSAKEMQVRAGLRSG